MTIVTDNLLGPDQYFFRDSVRREIQWALSQIGLKRLDYAEVFLIGLSTQEEQHQIVGVNPENGPLGADDLRSVNVKLSALLESHPNSDISLGHPGPYGSREKLQLRRCRAQAITEAIQDSGKLKGYEFFVSDSTPYKDIEIHICVGLPEETLELVPSLTNPPRDQYGTGRLQHSFAHATIHTCLESADMALYLPDPGRKPFVLENRAEIIRRSAGRFVDTIALTLTSNAVGLFSAINDISSQTYERLGARGQLIVAQRDDLNDGFIVTIEDPVGLRNTRSARRLLELTDETTALLTDGRSVNGLGMCPSAPNVAKIRIKGNSEWSLSIDGKELISVTHQQATLPKQDFDKNLFKEIVRRTLNGVHTERIWDAFQHSLNIGHGTTILVSDNPESEIARLAGEALAIRPKYLEHNDLARLGKIDGAILLGPDGRCYAFGVILDGMATASGDRARGSRYNSAVRYEQTSCINSVAIVISDDGTVDMIPPLMPKISRTEVAEAVQSYCNYPRLVDKDDEEWKKLDDQIREYGFYLNKEQCLQVNDAYESEKRNRRLKEKTLPHREPLQPNPFLDDSYFIE